MYNYFMAESVTSTQVMEALQVAGLGQGIVCLHSSLKSFGYVEGGADTVIRAFLDAGCTLLVPTFTANEVLPPAGRQILQNAWVGLNAESADVYDKNSTMVMREMGAIPARLLEMEGHLRSLHPLDSFAALGPLAQDLMERQTLLNVYGPFKAAYAHASAHLLLMGVDLTKATPIHLAEEFSGRRLFRRWARSVDDPTVQEVAVGSCSDGFNNLAPFLSELETHLTVGSSRWRVYPFAAFMDAATAAIKQNQQVTHCANVNCLRCNDGIKGGPLL